MSQIPPPIPTSPVPPPSEAGSKKLAAGLCGILLGGLGIHKFILGYTNAGIIMLAVTVVCFLGMIPAILILPCCIPVGPIGGAAMGIVGLIEGIMYLTKTDDEFYRTYMAGRKEWF